MPASDADLLRVHTQAHLDHVAAVSAAGGGNVARRFATTWVGPDGRQHRPPRRRRRDRCGRCHRSPAQVENAYCLHRPPGHHAEPDEAMGFCIYSSAAVAGLYALHAAGLERIAFVDWDAHHGNGTQAAFWTDPRALTISLHQDGAFPPGSGTVDEIGEGAAFGTNINIPLPPGSGEGTYLAAFDRIVLPALRAFRPGMIFVPSGFDAGGHDPLARMMLTSESFRRMTELLMEAAGNMCRRRIVMLHEGGYAPHIVPFMALAVFEALSGETTEVADPFLPALAGSPWQALQPHQDRAIAAAEQAGLAALLAR